MLILNRESPRGQTRTRLKKRVACAKTWREDAQIMHEGKTNIMKKRINWHMIMKSLASKIIKNIKFLLNNIFNFLKIGIPYKKKKGDDIPN